jgi:tetratricopeptide (TPR) repeat protein
MKQLLPEIVVLIYRIQGKYSQAEQLFKRSLAIYEKALGLEHPDLARIHNNLAELYRTQGKYAVFTSIEPTYVRVVG